MLEETDTKQPGVGKLLHNGRKQDIAQVINEMCQSNHARDIVPNEVRSHIESSAFVREYWYQASNESPVLGEEKQTSEQAHEAISTVYRNYGK